MAPRWLLKTEPSTYSFQQLERDKKTVWDGVRNALALKHLAQIRRGDAIAIYHTGDEKAVVGTATALSDPYADPKQKDPRLLVIDLAAARALPRPVTLAELKADPSLRDFPLVRLPRLSVMPVTTEQWAAIEKLAKQ